MNLDLTHKELSELIADFESAADYVRAASAWFHGPGMNSEGARAFAQLEAMVHVARRVLYAETIGQVSKLLQDETN